MKRSIARAALLCVAVGCAASPAQPPAVTPAPPARPTAAAPALGATGLSPEDAAALVAYHERVRAEVGVEPLSWSPEVAAYAQQWADHLAASDCQLVHRSPNPYGENLAQGPRATYAAVDAARTWESEKSRYRGGALTAANWAGSGHYTQMVWRATRQLGCGRAVCGSLVIFVCNYDPVGNVLGQEPY